jgi:hypothetical protein
MGRVDFAIPEGPSIELELELELEPRLESWNRRDDPSQVALRELVEHVRERIDPVLGATVGSLAFRLDVGLANQLDPLWERDLDSYLFPIARTLPDRVVSIWATKRRGARSFVHLEPAVPVTPSGWQEFVVPRSPTGEWLWKSAVRRSVESAAELPEGPVGLQLSYTVGPGRDWPGLWKASIDALEPLLGRTYRDREWNPLDGRIVRLGLHKSVDADYGADASMIVRARPADESWPDLNWLMSLDAAARRAFAEQHRGKQRARFERPAPPPAVPRPHDFEPRLRPRGEPLAQGVTVFQDDDHGYRAWLAANPDGWVINIQRALNPSDARLHHGACRTITGEPTRGTTWTGPYIKICSAELSHADAWAISYTGTTSVRCGTCKPPSAQRQTP